MEKLQITLTVFLITLTIGLLIAFLRSKKKIRLLQTQLDRIRGMSDDEISSRGKFSELGVLSAAITHEISNPLSIILGRVTQLQRHPEDLKGGLEQIKGNAERIATIIQSVRQYIYRTDERAEDFIPVREIIDGVMTFYGQRLKNHGIELRVRDVDNVFVSGHKGQYEQAILNLISNSFDAIDHSSEKKWIEISAKKDGNSVQIFVKDSGHGIPREVQTKMLDPFFTTKRGKGTGLGLTLVRGIAQRHGGTLRYLEDAPNTTFVLELPKPNNLMYHH